MCGFSFVQGGHLNVFFDPFFLNVFCDPPRDSPSLSHTEVFRKTMAGQACFNFGAITSAVTVRSVSPRDARRASAQQTQRTRAQMLSQDPIFAGVPPAAPTTE